MGAGIQAPVEPVSLHNPPHVLPGLAVRNRLHLAQGAAPDAGFEPPLHRSGPCVVGCQGDGNPPVEVVEQETKIPGGYGDVHGRIAQLIEALKKNPDSRRHIVSAWNPGEIEGMALPPCHALFQFYVAGGKLSCQLYQRSADIFLGVPFNIASYALLTLMVAQVCGYEPGDFVWTGGDCHLYMNHLEQARLQLSREPRALPQLRINPEVKDIFAFTIDDFTLEGYDPHPHIKAPVAV